MGELTPVVATLCALCAITLGLVIHGLVLSDRIRTLREDADVIRRTHSDRSASGAERYAEMSKRVDALAAFVGAEIVREPQRVVAKRREE